MGSKMLPEMGLPVKCGQRITRTKTSFGRPWPMQITTTVGTQTVIRTDPGATLRIRTHAGPIAMSVPPQIQIVDPLRLPLLQVNPQPAHQRIPLPRDQRPVAI